MLSVIPGTDLGPDPDYRCNLSYGNRLDESMPGGGGRFCTGAGTSHLHRRRSDGSYENAALQYQLDLGPIDAAVSVGSPRGPRPRGTSAPRIVPAAEPQRQKVRLYTFDEFAAMKPPSFLATGFIVERSLTVLHGAPGTKKSFAALGLALSVASGLKWLGIASVNQGVVVYVAGEGQRGIAPRIHAWREAHPGADIKKLRLTSGPVNLSEPASVEALLASIRELQELPAVMFFDTLSRCSVGVDENSAKEMGLVIAAADRIRMEVGAAVVLIHHTGRSGTMRGSTALAGAADTIISMREDRSGVVFTCEKQKDAEPFDPLTMRLRPIEGTDSCVLEVVPGDTVGELEQGRGPKARSSVLRQSSLSLLAVLAENFGDGGADTSAWKRASRLAPNTYNEARNQLLSNRFVEGDGTRTGRYTLTSRGKEALEGFGGS